jgi:GAF domain-containing protein
MTTSKFRSTINKMRWLPNFTLRTKLVVAFLIVALLPLGVLAYLNNRATQEVVINNADRALLAAAAQTADLIDDFIRVNLNAVRVESRLTLWSKYLSLPDEQRSDSELEAEVSSTLSDLSRKGQVFSPVFVPSYALLDRQGRNIIDTHVQNIELSESNEEYFQSVLQTGQPYISPVQFSESTREAALYFSGPVLDENGELVGVLRVRYNAAVLQQLVFQNTGLAGDQSFPILLDENLVRLADTKRPDLIYKSVTPLGPSRIAALQAVHRLPNLPESELFTDLSDFANSLANAVTQPNFAATAHPDEEVEQVAAVALKTQPWLVTFVQLRSVFLAPVAAQTRTALLLVGVGIVAVIIATFAVAHLLSRPIARLTRVAEQVARGDLSVQAQKESRDEIGTLAVTFNSMTSQLRELIDSLEERVMARTQRLEIAATLSEHLTAILDFDQLLYELVNKVKESFNYYHVHVYIIDNTGQNLVMTAGIGEAGVSMKASGHSIPLNAPTSLVARAARTGEIVRVDNVREAEDWLPNPLLPDTFAEIAVPIVVDEQVVGVLDVQEDEIAGLDEGDAALLRSLANQVAVAIRNARLFERVETALAEVRATQEQYLEQAWKKTTVTSGGQYLYAGPNATPPDEIKRQVMTEARQQALAQNHPAVIGPKDDSSAGKSLVAPINLRNKTIGVLQLHAASDGNQTWNKEDLALIEAVVDQLAQTAENLRLFQETRQQATREQAIREITDKLRAAPNLDALLETAARELGQRLEVRHTVLELGIETDSDDNGLVSKSAGVGK